MPASAGFLLAIYGDRSNNLMEVFETKWEQGEKLNGRLAMIGFIAALGAYVVTGQIIPGVF
tara:strand:+ start:816 stop:998 length:183 start_codon:yes stop_codon:yes gene_type:complete